jgi:hypothetical protein
LRIPALGDPAALPKIWEEVKKKIGGGGKTSEMGTVQARDSLPTTGYGDFRLNFSNILESYPGS